MKTSEFDLPSEVRRAETRIGALVRETPLARSLAFSEESGCELHFKLENLQLTGSFKVRGALNKVLSTPGEARCRGFVAASTGNHGTALAHALRELGAPLSVFIPQSAAPSKVEAIERLGGIVLNFGSDPVETEKHAREHAGENDLIYVSPYNDLDVIAGQGTIAVELARQLEGIDAVFVALGGGGLVSGIAGYLKSLSPTVRIVACSPENSPVMAKSIEAGRILELEARPTISDGTAGGVEPGAITFDLCRELVDDFVSVSEDEIHDAMRSFMQREHMLLEGAAGVAIAGFRKLCSEFRGAKVVVVVCGANIGLETLKAVL